MSKHVTPALKKLSFHCPHCGVLANQTWTTGVFGRYIGRNSSGSQFNDIFELVETQIAMCFHCGDFSIWIKEQMIYPLTGNVEVANEDLPEHIKKVYNEAKDIVNISPRGATALLRLAIQLLCIELGEKGKNINDDIASLVEKGLSPHIQQALDIVRVTGNHAVHPGTIELNDRPENAIALFSLVNFICNYFITQPKTIAALYGNLPEKDRTNIEKRDS